MRNTENFNGLAFFNNTVKLDIKTMLSSDIARLMFLATIVAIGLYAIQFINLG